MQNSKQGSRIMDIAVLLILLVASSIGLIGRFLPKGSTSVPANPFTQKTTHATATSAPPTATRVPPTATAIPAQGLTLQGTQITAINGKAVSLIGAQRSSLEYSCSGDGHFTSADFAAMRSWGMNTVRISLSSEYWANVNDSCPTYHQTVQNAIATAEASGLYVIVELQWNAPNNTTIDQQHGGGQCPMPDTHTDVAFWHDIATLYSHDQRVVFELFSEPFNVSWDTWLNGGTISDNCFLFLGGSSATQQHATYQAIGMKALTEHIRSIAPANIIIINGINWGYDLRGILNGYAIPGSNIMYGSHPYNYGGKQSGDWSIDFGQVARQYPVIVTEFGSYDCGTSYISSLITYLNVRHISWLAWTWNVGPCSQPALISNWNGTPNQPYGTYIQQQMLALAKQ